MDEVHDSLNVREESDQSLWSAILLISGTCIGAGMLALPVVTGLSGFYPSLITGALTWFFMVATGLLLLEVVLWMPDGANVLSITGHFLGRSGEVIAGILYIFLYYCLMVSYIAGGAPLFEKMLSGMFGITVPSLWSLSLFTALFGLMVLWGTKFVGRINWLLMAGLIISFIALVAVGSTEVTEELLVFKNWGFTLVAAPTLVSAYGYHNIIPTLSTYMKRDAMKLRTAIFVGTALPFVVYTLWQWVILGSIAPEALQEAATRGITISHLLQDVTANPWISRCGMYFGFFALVTSFLGVGLAMVDFLGDGFGSKRSGFSRVWLCLLVFIPPALLAASYPGIFIKAIGVAGGFGEAILNGLIPVIMVWIGRYRLGLTSESSLFGGRMMLGLLAFCTIFVIALETMHLLAP